MPLNISTPVLFYNKAMFEEAGLDPDRPPITLEELRDYSQQIVDSGAATYGIALDAGANSGGAWFLEQWFARAGLPYADNDNGRTARATQVLFDTPEGAELLDVRPRSGRPTGWRPMSARTHGESTGCWQWPTRNSRRR